MFIALILALICMVIVGIILDYALYWIIFAAGAFFIVRGIVRFIRRHWTW